MGLSNCGSRLAAFLLGMVAIGTTSAVASPQAVTGYADPFIGTHGTGHTFPGASVPFAMVAPGPDNADGGWDFSSGYQYHAPRIIGFSNTHISGAGIPELGDVLIQPASGRPWTATTGDFSSPYDKRSERAEPGYYAVSMPNLGVRVELSAAWTVAYHRIALATQDRRRRCWIFSM